MRALSKTKSEIGRTDVGMNLEYYPNMWALLAEKDYQLYLEILRAIHSVRKLPLGFTSISDESFNKKV